MTWFQTFVLTVLIITGIFATVAISIALLSWMFNTFGGLGFVAGMVLVASALIATAVRFG